MEFSVGTLVAAIIASFLSGMALSSMTMLFSFSSKLTKFDTTLEILTKQLNSHVNAPTIICGYHGKLEDDVNTLKTQAALNKTHIEQLEDNR